jgi:hypothetical protein
MAKSKAAKAGAAAAAVKESQYLRRVIDDEDLRDNIVEAYASLRDAYDRLSNGKHPASALLDDKKLQKDLRSAAESLREAKHGIKGEKQRSGGFGKLLLVTIVGAGLALALSEGLRKKVLDALFGAEEEFEYTSVTTPSTAAGGGAPGESASASTSTSTGTGTGATGTDTGAT